MKKIIFLPLSLIILLLIIGGIQLSVYPNIHLMEIIKLGLSWPVLTIIFFSSFIWLFEDPIRKFLYEFRDIEASGVRISRQIEQEQSVEALPTSAVNKLILDRDAEWQTALETERMVAAVSFEEMRKDAIHHIQQLQFENVKWRFKYADVHLVMNTKIVLGWLNAIKLVSYDTFDSAWKPIISDKKEREAIFNALLDLEFLQQEGDNYKITELGAVYVEFLKINGVLKDSR